MLMANKTLSLIRVLSPSYCQLWYWTSSELQLKYILTYVLKCSSGLKRFISKRGMSSDGLRGRCCRVNGGGCGSDDGCYEWNGRDVASRAVLWNYEGKRKIWFWIWIVLSALLTRDDWAGLEMSSWIADAPTGRPAEAYHTHPGTLVWNSPDAGHRLFTCLIACLFARSSARSSHCL